MAKNNIPWFMNPKSPIYKAFLKNQKFGMSSSIQASKNALKGDLYDPNKNPALLNAQSRAGMDVNADPSVTAYDSVLGGIQSNEAINKNYADQLARVSELISGTNYGRGGESVSAATAGMGANIGVDPSVTANLAQTAGTVSGMGGQGGDVYSKAILGSAAVGFNNARAEDIRNQASNRQQLTLGRGGEVSRLNQMKAQAGTEAAGLQTQMLEGKQGLLTGIAGLRDQQRAAYNPFAMPTNQQAYISGNITNATAYAKYKAAGGKRSYKSFMSTGGGNPSATNPAGPTGA